MFTLQSFRQSISLMSSQHFHAWSALQTSVWVRPHDLASARHAWHSFKMLAIILILLSQSYLVVSHPSNVGMTLIKDMVRFICNCVEHKVSVHCCIAVCRGSSTGLQGGCSCNIMASCHSFSVRCASSSICVGVGGRS